MEQQIPVQENPINSVKKKSVSSSWSSGRFLGGFLIGLGIYFFGRKMGWLDDDFSFWAVFMILVGIWLVSSKWHQR